MTHPHDEIHLDRPVGAVVVAAVAVFALVCVLIFSLQATHSLAAQGAQSHDAICAFKADLQKRADDSRAFLALTAKQREAKYGPAIGAIPASTIRQSLINQEKTITSLSGISCR